MSMKWLRLPISAGALSFLVTALSVGQAAPGTPRPAAAKGDELFLSKVIPHIRIEISPEGMEILRHYEFDINDLMERTNVLATVHEGKTVYTNVVVHLKGHLGSFRPVDSKPAFTLNFDKNAKGQRFHGLQKLHLNNSVQDYSYVSEQISRELFLKAGIPTPRASHATVELNDRALGLYVLVEGWNKQLLKRYFKNPNGNLYDGGFGKDITYPLDATSGDDPENRALLDILAAACKENDLNKRLDEIKQVLDLDRFITFMAMEIICAHWDGYSLNKNNFRAYEDPEISKLVFLPHGMDQMFGVWRMRPTSPITPQMKGLVSSAVMQTKEGRRLYLDRMAQLLTNVFDVHALCTEVDELSAKIRPALAGDASGLQYQQQAASQLQNRIIQRVASVREQLATANEPMKFDANGSHQLTGWDLHRDSGNPGFSRRGNELHITASGRPAFGSWRTMVRVDRGEYQLIGKLKLQNFELISTFTNKPGATLRISGERLAAMVTNAPDWKTVTYDFTVEGLSDLEVVCELRGMKGEAIFDATSLRVRKLR